MENVSIILQGLGMIGGLFLVWNLNDKKLTRCETKIETLEVQMAAQMGDFKELRESIQTLNINVAKLTEVMNIWKTKIEHRDV